MTAETPTKFPSRLQDMKGPVIFLVLAVALLLAANHTPLRHSLSLEHIAEQADHLGVWGPFLLLAVGTLSPLFFLPRWPVAFVSGLLYGIAAGTALATVASLCGAALHFSLASNLFAPLTDRLRRRYPALERMMRGDHLFVTLLLLRAFPLSSFVATNLLAGALRVPWRTYLAASFLGMIPSTLMYCAWGKLMKKPSAEFYVLAVAIVLLLSIGTWIARRVLRDWLSPSTPRGPSP